MAKLPPTLVVVASLSVLVACAVNPPGAGRSTPSSARSEHPYVEPERCAPPTDAAIASPERPSLVVQERPRFRLQHVEVSPAGFLATLEYGGDVRIYDVERRSLLRVVHADIGQPIPTRITWDGPKKLAIVGSGAPTIAFVDPLGRPLDVERSTRHSVRTAAGSRLRSLVTQVIAEGPAWFIDGAEKHWDLVPPKELAATGLYTFDDAQVATDDSTIVVKPRAQRGVVVAHRPLDAPGRIIARDVYDYALSPHGDAIAVLVRGAPVLIDTTTGASRPLEPLREGSVGSELRFSVDGRYLLAFGGDTLAAWSVSTGKRAWQRLLGEAPTDVLTTEQGRVIVVNATVNVLDEASGRFHHDLLDAQAVGTSSIAFDGAGAIVASASRARVDVWSLDRGVLASSLRVDGAREVAVASNGEVTVARSTGATCTPPGGSAGAGIGIELLHGSTIDAVCIRGSSLASPTAVDGFMAIDPLHRRALIADRGEIVDLTTGAVVKLEKSSRSIPMFGYSMTDDLVTAAAYTSQLGIGGWLVVWDARTGKHLYDLGLNPNEAAWALPYALSPDGKTIALAKNRAVAWYDARTGTELRRVGAPVNVLGLAFAGADLLTLDTEGALARYADGKDIVRGVPTRAGTLVSLVVEPGNKRAAAFGAAGVVVWDLASLRSSATLTAFEDAEWIAYTNGGAYTGTSEVADRVAFVYGNPPEAFPFEQFAAAYRSPEIVRRRLGGEDVDGPPMVRPPEIAITSAPRVEGQLATLQLDVRGTQRVDAVRVFAGGRPVAAQRVCAANGHVTMHVDLLPGLNRLAAVAYDARGVASNPVIADVTCAKSAGVRPTIWVVAVGVSQYPHLAAKDQLALADADASSVAAALGANAGPNGLYERADIKLLLNAEATRARVLEAIDALATMSADDVAIVFFAGHGAQPTPGEDTRVLTSDTAATSASVRATGIGWDDIASRLARARGRVLVLLDACHSGGITQGVLVPNEELAGSLARTGRAGAIVLAASKGRQVSYEPGGSRGLVLDPGVKQLVATNGEPHGFFTGALLRALADKATDRDQNGVVEISELVDEVTSRVTKVSNGAQTPWVARRELIGDFALTIAASK